MRGYIKDSCEKKCKTVEDCKKATCCGCDGVAIALGLFALGLFMVITTTLVLSVVFCTCPISIIALIISTIAVLFVLTLIYRLFRVCIFSHHSSWSDRIDYNKW